jgi:hypothetical protein
VSSIARRDAETCAPAFYAATSEGRAGGFSEIILDLTGPQAAHESISTAPVRCSCEPRKLPSIVPQSRLAAQESAHVAVEQPVCERWNSISARVT